MTVELFDAGDAERLREALELRFEVFVDEQGVPPEEEVDEHDRAGSSAVHALIRDASGKVAGTGRFYDCGGGEAKIGRLAVRKSARGTGAGAAMLRALMDAAGVRGFTRARLDAQVHAAGFYERAGFVAQGEQLMDAGILHQPMVRSLTDVSSNY